MVLIIYGYVKINFLANYVINYIIFEKIEKLAETSPQLAAYCTMFSQGFNGYLQFSGYSDIAIGFSLLLGYRVMENFNWPFFKKNIQEFWSAWHISLTSWCPEYVYLATFSLTRERWLGILVAMGVLGLWHEFSARYLLWGAYNGLGIVIWYQWRKIAQSAPLIVLPSAHGLGVLKDMGAICLNLHFVLLGFVLVNNENLTGAVKFYRILFGV